MKVLGIDEAGRGPVLGSLIVAGVFCRDEELPKLQQLRVRDSKKLSRRRREQLFEELVSSFSYSFVELTPEEIDSRHRRRESLNQMEIRAILRLLDHFSPDVAYIDCIGPSAEKLLRILEEAGAPCRLVVEHKADERYPIVSAASIVAKVIRDRKLDALKREYGDFGSGYPSDPRTLDFLRRHISKPPPFVRCSWRTLSRLKNRTLDE